MWGTSTLIILCLWYLRRCWLNYLIKKYNKEARHDVMRKLGGCYVYGTFRKSVLEMFEDV